MNIPCKIGGPVWGLRDWAEIHQWRDCFRGQILTLYWGNRLNKKEALLSAGLRYTENLETIETQLKWDAQFSEDRLMVQAIRQKFLKWRESLES
jgi:hypothetical protein